MKTKPIYTTLKFIPQDIAQKYGVIIHDNKVKVCKGSLIGHIQYNCNGIQMTETADGHCLSIHNYQTKEYILLWRHIDYVVIHKSNK